MTFDEQHDWVERGTRGVPRAQAMDVTMTIGGE